jgi:hypothetical protein
MAMELDDERPALDVPQAGRAVGAGAEHAAAGVIDGEADDAAAMAEEGAQEPPRGHVEEQGPSGRVTDERARTEAQEEDGADRRGPGERQLGERLLDGRQTAREEEADRRAVDAAVEGGGQVDQRPSARCRRAARAGPCSTSSSSAELRRRAARVRFCSARSVTQAPPAPRSSTAAKAAAAVSARRRRPSVAASSRRISSIDSWRWKASSARPRASVRSSPRGARPAQPLGESHAERVLNQRAGWGTIRRATSGAM